MSYDSSVRGKYFRVNALHKTKSFNVINSKENGLFGSSKKKQPLPLKGARIEDYALIGDCETAALVSREGSIDWLCWPTFSSGACFAALLGTAENGYWSLRPSAEIRSTSRRYRPDTMVLETTYVTDTGEVCVTDFMPPRGKNSDIIRIVQGIRGKTQMRMELAIRFDYGLTIPWVTRHEDELRAVAGENMVVLRTQCGHGPSVEFEGEDLKTVSNFEVTAGNEACFTLTYSASNADIPKAVSPQKELANTISYWSEWSERAQFDGPFKASVARSLMTLKAMT
ncbi:MAG: trehalase-like domain-containing protein, partial [Bryocella sp.]